MSIGIKDWQDRMVGFVLEAKELQTKSGMSVGLAMEGNTMIVPVDLVIKSLISMTTREDLKERLVNAQKATN